MITTFFGENLLCKSPVLEILPCFHTCDAYFFKKIINSRSLCPSLCRVFDKDLLYLNYGRPAYKSSLKGHSKLKSMQRVIFILNPYKIGTIEKSFPFDSGAFQKGMFKSFLHPSMTLDEFNIRPELHSLAKTVGCFFKSNERYFENKPHPDLSYDILDFPVECFYKLINNPGVMAADDRRSTIELQLTHNIELTRGALLGVIMPIEFKNSPEVKEILVKEIGAKILTFDSFGVASPLHYTEMLNLARKFLQKKKF